MAANEVVYFHSAETGAPTLNNAAGSLIGVLDACLITGFRPITLTSLSVSGGVATATFAGHGNEADRLVDIGGAAVGALNGRKRIQSSASGTFTFDATGVADNPAVGGTITCKRSPLGWTKLHTGTNKAIYQRSAVAARAMLLRVDDTNSGVAASTYARALMVEAAGTTGVDAYGPASPTPAMLSGGHYWSKGPDSATAKGWALIGDGLSFYLFTDNGYTGSTGGLSLASFGDLVANRAGDGYASYLLGHDESSLGAVSVFNGPTGLSTSPTQASLVLARKSSQLGACVFGGLVTTYTDRYPGGQGPAYPSPVDNGVEIQFPAHVREANAAFGHPFRGLLPGLGWPLANVGNQLHKVLLDPVAGLGRKMRAVAVATQFGTAGCLLLDETGPWQ